MKRLCHRQATGLANPERRLSSVVPLEAITISPDYRKRPTTAEVIAMAGRSGKILAPAANHSAP